MKFIATAQKAYDQGKKDERERCARIIESAGMYLSGDQEDARESDLLSLANKIRSGE